MTYLLQSFNSRFILGPVVMFWAVICAATAGVTTWQGLLVLRFFLGTPALPTLSTDLANFGRFHGVYCADGFHDHR